MATDPPPPHWIDTPDIRFGIVDAASGRSIPIVDGYVQGVDGQAYGVSVTNKRNDRFQLDLFIDNVNRGKFIIFGGGTFVMKTPLESRREFIMAAKASSALGPGVASVDAGLVQIQGQFETSRPVELLAPGAAVADFWDGATGSLVPPPATMAINVSSRPKNLAMRRAAPKAAVTELGRDTGKSYNRISVLEVAGPVIDLSLRLAIKPKELTVLTYVAPAPPLE